MTSLNHVFVIADRPSREPVALQRAADLQRLSGASVDIVGFCYHGLYDQQVLLSDAEREHIQTSLCEERFAWLDDRVRELGFDRDKTSIEVIWCKDIAEWIVDKQAQSPFDLTIKSRNPGQPVLSKSLDRQLMNHNPSSVFLCGHADWPLAPKILATLDLRVRDDAHRRMNEAVLRGAHEFARMHDGEVHYAYAIELSDVLRDLDIMPLERARKLSIDKSADLLLDLLDPYDIDPLSIHYPQGKIGPAIEQLAAQISADVIVIGTTTRQGLGGVLLGSSAERIVKETDRDVLLVRNELPGSSNRKDA